MTTGGTWLGPIKTYLHPDDIPETLGDNARLLQPAIQKHAHKSGYSSKKLRWEINEFWHIWHALVDMNIGHKSQSEISDVLASEPDSSWVHDCYSHNYNWNTKEAVNLLLNFIDES
jgi:hypothetical protein